MFFKNFVHSTKSSNKQHHINKQAHHISSKKFENSHFSISKFEPNQTNLDKFYATIKTNYVLTFSIHNQKLEILGCDIERREMGP